MGSSPIGSPKMIKIINDEIHVSMEKFDELKNFILKYEDIISELDLANGISKILDINLKELIYKKWKVIVD